MLFCQKHIYNYQTVTSYQDFLRFNLFLYSVLCVSHLLILRLQMSGPNHISSSLPLKMSVREPSRSHRNADFPTPSSAQ